MFNPLCLDRRDDRHFFTLTGDLRAVSRSWEDEQRVHGISWRGDPPDHHTGWGSSPYAAPPPRISAVRHSGAEQRTQPSACSAVHCLHAAVLAGAKRRMSLDDKCLSSEGWLGTIMSWVTMKKMFHECFSFFFL